MNLHPEAFSPTSAELQHRNAWSRVRRGLVAVGTVLAMAVFALPACSSGGAPESGGAGGGDGGGGGGGGGDGGGGGGVPTPSARWSDPLTWPDGVIPGDNANVHIGPGQAVLLDVATASLDRLRIEGDLVADPESDVAITARSIEVLAAGTLQIGTGAAPHANTATITMTGPRSAHTPRSGDNALDNDAVARGLRVMPGGTLRLFGTVPQRTRTWLADHAAAGATSFVLADAVTWRAGDRIAISTTDFHGVGQTEILTLAADTTGPALQTTTPLQTFRWGRMQYPLDVPINGTGMSLTPGTFTTTRASTPRELDQRAEIVNLTRRIVVQGANDAAWTTDGFGAHVMVMGLDSSAQVSGVEFRRCGQRRAMGRYPFHWHMLSYTAANAAGQGGGEYLGDAPAGTQFLRRSSVWDSSNRAVTVHGTCGVTVDDVYAVDIRGHAFFFEDGSEMRNTITGCVAMKVRDPGGNRLKQHDDAPSGFWLTNPVNTITGNSASDCDGRGLWNSFANVCFGDSRNCNVQPGLQVVHLYEDNIGHGNRLQGLVTEFVVINEAGAVLAQRYDPGQPFTMSRNRVWKNNDGGYQNRVGAARYLDWTAADNNTRDFQGQSIKAVMQGTLLIGRSLNSATPFADPRRIGLASYHYNLDIEDIVAINYPFQGPTIAVNSQFVYGAGVFDSSDLYDRAIGLGNFRNPRWKLVNSNPGYLTPPPYFDGFPLTTGTPGKFRYWTLPGAIWDPHGYWGPAGNYLIPNRTFYTHGIGTMVAVAPAGSNGWSTPHVFYGLHDVTLDNDTPQGWGGPSLVPMRLARLDTSNVEIAEQTIGEPSQSLFFPGMRYFSVASGGRYKLTIPSGRMPVSELRVQFENLWRPTDRVLVGLPWPGNVPVTGRFDSGYDGFSQAQKVANNTTRLFVNNGTSIAHVLADTTGARIWQDTANNTVWVQPVGGMALNVYGYDGRSEDSLRRMHVIRLWPQ